MSDPFDVLTRQQRVVAQHLAAGLTCHQIADLLEISHKTAETHRGAVLFRLKLKNVVELARLAIRVELEKLRLDPTPSIAGDEKEIAFRHGWNSAIDNVRDQIG
jgi:DNA-binding CsgD family transcriptional regulator